MIAYLTYGLLITAALLLFNRLRQSTTAPVRRKQAESHDNAGNGSDNSYYGSSAGYDDRDNDRDCRNDDDGSPDNACDSSDSGGDGGGGGD